MLLHYWLVIMLLASIEKTFHILITGVNNGLDAWLLLRLM